MDWKKSGGGHMEYRQPRCLGSAVLHRSEKESVLFVLNHYPEAVRFNIELKNKAYKKLVDLDGGKVTELVDGRVLIEIDWKSDNIYRVE